MTASQLIYDLHCHSNASDGALPPADLVHLAVEKGVDVLALTDHDGTEGIMAARQAAASLPIQLVAGLEISVTWSQTTIHIVGLHVDINNTMLQQGLARLRDYRRDRALAIAHRLDKAGIPDAYAGASQYASETMLGRMHFAQFLVDQGHAKDTRDVFKRFLVRNKPGYVPGNWADLDQALDWIHGAGGQAVIAHPARYKITATKLRRLIADFKACGGEGFEVCSGRQHADEVRHLATLANRHELLASCGSDFHSPAQSWTELGKITPLPASVTPIWSNWPVRH
ncbi:metal-dependent phosphoesterase [Methylophaga frappieri]|uniref:Metal-dependent phosphoesterase n=1 Tax=Methylophaga frappieri (strain ATCC BAA-2434 / DSM 25690 / JAM7) TaxID=754477 RepID=I1YKG3_METFJ|nr:PHP domain-containing protein [Methylophaga frappieri]AFJ03406.1 metal-dependent phosphoesterase [Methylophaga frappieri]